MCLYIREYEKEKRKEIIIRSELIIIVLKKVIRKIMSLYIFYVILTEYVKYIYIWVRS